MTIPMKKARERLATVWFVGALLLFAVLIVQSITRYGGLAQQVWEWFLPTVLPTLTLVLGVMAATAIHAAETQRRVSRFFYRLAMSISFFYLLAVASIFLLEPFKPDDMNTQDLMRQSSLFLGPLQGLVSGCLGVFFLAKDKEGAHASSPGAPSNDT